MMEVKYLVAYATSTRENMSSIVRETKWTAPISFLHQIKASTYLHGYQNSYSTLGI